MAATKTAKTTTTPKAPAQTKLPVEETKKPEAEVKAATKKEETKKEEVKETVTTEEVPAANKTEEVKPAARRGRKPGSTNKKSARKTTTTRKTTKKENDEGKTEVFIQYAGQEFSEKSIIEKVEAAWVAEGKKTSAIKKVKLYVKPEEGKAYYVINEGLKNGSTGVIDM